MSYNYNISILLYLSIITYAIVRYRLLDIKVAVTRVGIFLFVYLFVLGLPLYMGYAHKKWQQATYLAVILATIGPFMYRYFKIKAEQVFSAVKELLAEVDRERSAALEKRSDHRDRRNLAAAITAGIWIGAVLDAALLGPDVPEDESPAWEISFLDPPARGSMGIGIRRRF